MSNLYFISDTHFHHKNICQHAGRPYSSMEEMNEALIKNWNDVVKPKDIIWHLGDFSFSDYPTFKVLLNRLNGTLNLCLGNHDKMIIKHKEELLKIRFNSIQHYHELKINNQLIVMNHYSQRIWRNSHHNSIHIFGHSHGSLPPFGKSVDVGVDCKEITSEYRPISLDELFEYMSKREISIVDHHKQGVN